MIGQLSAPFRTLVVALGGALLAVLWLRTGPLLPVAIVAILLIVVALARVRAKSIAHRTPSKALSLLEFQVVGILGVSAALAGVVIGVTVTFTLDEEIAKEFSTSTKEIIAAVGAALTAFVSGLAVTEEDVDGRIGKLVEKTFREAFITSGTAGPNQVLIKQTTDAGQRAAKAIETTHDFGWTDWSSDNRAKRVEAIEAYVAGHP